MALRFEGVRPNPNPNPDPNPSVSPKACAYSLCQDCFSFVTHKRSLEYGHPDDYEKVEESEESSEMNPDYTNFLRTSWGHKQLSQDDFDATLDQVLTLTLTLTLTLIGFRCDPRSGEGQSRSIWHARRLVKALFWISGAPERLPPSVFRE